MKTLFISDDGVKDTRSSRSPADTPRASMPPDRRTRRKTPGHRRHRRPQEAYNTDPGRFFLEGYAAALAVVNAIEKAKSTEYNALVKALRTNYVNPPWAGSGLTTGETPRRGVRHVPGAEGIYVEVK